MKQTLIAIIAALGIAGAGCHEVVTQEFVEPDKDHPKQSIYVKQFHTEYFWGGVSGETIEMVDYYGGIKTTCSFGGYNHDLGTNVTQVCVSQLDETVCKDIDEVPKDKITGLDFECKKYKKYRGN